MSPKCLSSLTLTGTSVLVYALEVTAGMSLSDRYNGTLLSRNVASKSLQQPAGAEPVKQEL